MMQPVTGERTTAVYARGALFGLAAVSIWAGNIVVAGLGLRSSLTPWDISAIRFAVAGLVLVPYLMRRGLALDRLGWIGLAALVLGGAPTVLLANAGLLFRTGITCRRALSWRHATDGRRACSGDLERGVYAAEESWVRANCHRGCGHRLGQWGYNRYCTEYWPPVVSRLCAGLCLLHSCDASSTPRWASRGRHLCSWLNADLHASVCNRGRYKRLRRLGKRHRPPSARAGSPDGGHLLHRFTVSPSAFSALPAEPPSPPLARR